MQLYHLLLLRVLGCGRWEASCLAREASHGDACTDIVYALNCNNALQQRPPCAFCRGEYLPGTEPDVVVRLDPKPPADGLEGSPTALPMTPPTGRRTVPTLPLAVFTSLSIIWFGCRCVYAKRRRAGDALEALPHADDFRADVERGAVPRTGLRHPFKSS